MNAVIYARCANKSVLGFSAVEHQLAVCRKYANDRNYTIVREYTDDGFNGISDYRPAFTDMLEAAKHGNFDALILYNLNRLYRNSLDIEKTCRLLSNFNIEIISVLER